MRKKILLTTLVACLLLIFSCEKDNDNEQDNIIGTWQLTSVTIDGADTTLSSYPGIIQFQANNIFQTYNENTAVKERGGWSYEGGMLNISIYLPAAYYVLQADAQILSLKRLDFNSNGTLSETISNYQSVPDTEIP